MHKGPKHITRFIIVQNDSNYFSEWNKQLSNIPDSNFQFPIVFLNTWAKTFALGISH